MDKACQSLNLSPAASFTTSFVETFVGFEQLTAGGHITLAACWANARRKFYEIPQADALPIAAEAVRRIAELYTFETKVRASSPEQRLALRQASSRPFIYALRVWLETQLPHLAARGKLAKAIRYALTRWDGLSLFLGDGRTNPMPGSAMSSNAWPRAIPKAISTNSSMELKATNHCSNLNRCKTRTLTGFPISSLLPLHWVILH